MGNFGKIAPNKVIIAVLAKIIAPIRATAFVNPKIDSACKTPNPIKRYVKYKAKI
jgi:hypothetical protein